MALELKSDKKNKWGSDYGFLFKNIMVSAYKKS